MHKYIGKIIEIIYEDRKGKITQRKIEILGVKNGRIKAKCLKSNALRIFNEENILSWRLSKGSGVDAS